jgi:hypothetical protein
MNGVTITEDTKQDKHGDGMKPGDIERWASGQSNYETVHDASDGLGHCRWCGGKTSGHYPKSGRALNYRCCSLFCQLLYASTLGLFAVPVKNGGEINWAEGRRRLSTLEDVALKGNKSPDWYEGFAVVRYCANLRDGRHSLPHTAKAAQDFCGSACRQAAYRTQKAKAAFIKSAPTTPSAPISA